MRFTSSVPLHTFDGESDNLIGHINLADSTVDFYVDINTLKTGIGKRDKDMRKTLETDRFPFAEFYGKLVSPFDDRKVGQQSATVLGRFSIHGVTSDIEVTGTLERLDTVLSVAASWTIRLEDYEITPPSFLIMKVDEVQSIQIEAKLVSEHGKLD